MQVKVIFFKLKYGWSMNKLIKIISLPVILFLLVSSLAPYVGPIGEQGAADVKDVIIAVRAVEQTASHPAFFTVIAKKTIEIFQIAAGLKTSIKNPDDDLSRAIFSHLFYIAIFMIFMIFMIRHKFSIKINNRFESYITIPLCPPPEICFFEKGYNV